MELSLKEVLQFLDLDSVLHRLNGPEVAIPHNFKFREHPNKFGTVGSIFVWHF